MALKASAPAVDAWIVGERALRVCAVVVAIAVAALVLPGRPAGAEPTAAEQAFVVAINGLRADRDLAPLRVDAELSAIARRWAGQMANAGGISHNAGFSGQVTANWHKLGENVGRGPDVEDLMRAFVESPSHYANLVDADFAELGVGVIERDGELWTAHQFMVVFDEPAPAPAPALVRTPASPAAQPPAAPAAPPALPTAAPSAAPSAAPPGASPARPTTAPSADVEAIAGVLAQLRQLDAA